MTDVPHSIRCARRVAREVKTAKGSDYEAARAVHRHCGVSLLRAHRIARGYTLVEAVEALKEALAARGTPATGLSHQRMSQWEQGQDIPSPRYLDGLCLLYRTRPDRLGFGHDYSDTASDPRNELQDNMDRRHFVSLAAAGAVFMSAPFGPGPHGEDLDPPGGPRATAAYVTLLEDLTEQSGYRLYSSPAEYIPARMIDLARTQACLLTTTATDIRRRLHRIYAKNAGFIAIRLNDVAGASDTFEWFGIARRAARQAEDPAVLAWLAGRVGDAFACHGRLDNSLAAARSAQTLGGSRANPAAVLGHLIEAGAQARSGCRRGTLHAVREADRLYARLPAEQNVPDGFHVSEYLLRWHQSNALALVGAHAEAAPLRARVLELPLARHDQVGTALLHLDAAAAQADGGDVEAACDTITAAWLELPEELRVGQIPQRAHEILRSLDTRRATHRRAAEVRELLESATRRDSSA
ncbi:helix-turn-helix domain-containing protein [Nocardia sp. NPDC003482]